MKTFNIIDYGAKICDRLQTLPIQTAIDECFLAGGGRVIIPCGVYITGGLRLRSNVELYLESGAILKGSRNPEDYFGWKDDKIEPLTIQEDEIQQTLPYWETKRRWNNALIRTFNAKNVAITGEKGSYFDGCYCFDPIGEQEYRGPHGINMWNTQGIRLSGYTFINASNWCHAIFCCQDITVKNIAIHGGCDGVNVHSCDNVLVEDCNINSGDDCIAGFNNNDVIVRNCTLNTACMPVRFGGNNVLIENCISNERNFGSRRWMSEEEKKMGNLTSERDRHESHTSFSYYCDYRTVIRKTPGNIVIRNCHFAQEHELIRVEYDGRHRYCRNRGLKDLTLENCSVGDICKTGMLWGKDVEKLTCYFRNVKISCRKGFEDIPMLVAGNFDKIVFENCEIEGFSNPTILVGTDGAENIEVINSTPITVKKATVKECFDAHPGGVSSADFGKDYSTLNYY